MPKTYPESQLGLTLTNKMTKVIMIGAPKSSLTLIELSYTRSIFNTIFTLNYKNF